MRSVPPASLRSTRRRSSARAWLAILAALLGVISPSYLIICIIAAFLRQFSHLVVVQHAFAGISISVCAMVLNAVWKLIAKSATDKLTVAVLAVTALVTILFGVSPVVIVIAASCVGILAHGGKGGAS